jgi:hypothetical protein
MRKAVAAVGVLVLGAVGCSTSQSAKHTADMPPPPVEAAPAPMPTVPPKTPTPEAAAVPLATRPIGDDKAAEAGRKAGKDIGPVVTFAGIARADGSRVEPTGTNAQGYPIFQHPVGAGFMVVIEGKPGISNLEVARGIFRYDAADPTQQPDLQVEVNRALGDGSEAVCDARRPTIGGVPAVNPPSFAQTAKVSGALNDLACRFESFIESNASCTVNKYGDFEFVSKQSKVQFCMVVARSWQFPLGDTLVSVRLRDTDGNPGPVSHFVMQYKAMPTPERKATAAPTPTAPRRRL